MSRSAAGQEAPREFTLPGGVGVRLDPTSGHTIVAYPADGGVALLCLQGDEHAGLEAMRWIQRETAESSAELPGSRRPSAGAIGVIVVDNFPGSPSGMGASIPRSRSRP